MQKKDWQELRRVRVSDKHVGVAANEGFVRKQGEVGPYEPNGT